MKTQDWIPQQTPVALLIGHDPRLQASETIASYALFADYYNRNNSGSASERKKQGLAQCSFEQISYLTNNQIRPEQLYITNLCNESLPHAPKGKTVYIPEQQAKDGIENIKTILQNNPGIHYIFPMSLQVNYWLQQLGFYSSNDDFVKLSVPSRKGIENAAPYYAPKTQGSFLMICGNQYKLYDGRIIIPILHSKNYPLNRKMVAYEECYDRIRTYFKQQ